MEDGSIELELKSGKAIRKDIPNPNTPDCRLRIGNFCFEYTRITFCTLPIALFCLPFYCITWLFFGKPPHVMPLYMCCHLPCLCCRRRAVVNYTFCDRLIVFIRSIEHLIAIPMRGFYWHLDEILYPEYRSVDEGNDPVFLIQSSRVGSTSMGIQLFKLLNKDDKYLALNMLHNLAPYLWQWKLFGCLCSPCGCNREKVFEKIQEINSEEMKKRHHIDPYSPDTFFVLYDNFYTWGGQVTMMLTSSPWPNDEHLFQWHHESHIPWFEAMAKKFMYYEGKQHVIMKTHDITMASELSRIYPKAKFVNMIRNGGAVLESTVNYMYVAGTPDKSGFYIPVALIAMSVPICLRLYRKEEALFYGNEPDRKITVKFKDWVKDPDIWLRKILALLGNDPDEPEINEIMKDIVKEHKGPRGKRSYGINFHLEDLYEENFIRKIKDYIAVGLYDSECTM